MNDQSEIEKLIEQGKHLKLKLVEYVELKKFYEDVQEWKAITRRVFSDWKNPAFSVEYLRKHIQNGWNLEVEDKEDLGLLETVCDLATNWKIMTRKLLSLRPFALLEPKVAPKEENGDNKFSLILQRELDRQAKPPRYSYKLVDVTMRCDLEDKYCVCRRFDDGISLMISCDTCSEWFHADCVGMSLQLCQKLKSYLCIGCARRFHNFKPLFPQDFQVREEEGNELQDPALYQVFTQERRPDYFEFTAILLRGAEEIPIFLEELETLTDLDKKVQLWRHKAQEELDLGIDHEGLEEEVNNTIMLHCKKAGEEQKEESKKPVPSKSGERDKRLMNLYLESESFPLELEETEDLVILVKARDWCREALRVLTLHQQINQTPN